MSVTSKTGPCPICQTSVEVIEDLTEYRRVFSCPICGRLEFYPAVSTFKDFNWNHLSVYLAYNGYPQNDLRYFSTRSKEYCAEKKHEFETNKSNFGYPVHLTPLDVENWYPKRFSEKVDFILQWIESHTPYWGSPVLLENDRVYANFFVEQFEYIDDRWMPRPTELRNEQLKYIVNCLVKQEYIESPTSYTGRKRPITLTPKGYSRLDDIRIELNSQKDVLVAMKFGDDTLKLRNSIRKGIQTAGYHPIFIDEVEHNDFITPELLKYIKNSKFIVVDLTHQNNGAYFEEGYAMRLGKPVIQLCKKDVKLHFDIAQKNTIFWTTEDEITDRLPKRILATIE